MGLCPALKGHSDGTWFLVNRRPSPTANLAYLIGLVHLPVRVVVLGGLVLVDVEDYHAGPALGAVNADRSLLLEQEELLEAVWVGQGLHGVLEVVGDPDHVWALLGRV